MNKFELSYGQKSLFFLQQANPDDTSYNLGIAFKNYNKFNEEYLMKTLKIILKHNEMLKVKFLNENGKVFQSINQDERFDLTVKDIGGLDESKIPELVDSDLHISYNLEKDSMLRVYLYKNTSYDLIMFNIHHVVADFWSIELLIDQFIRIYHGIENGKDLKEFSKTNDYYEFISDEKKYIMSSKYSQKLDYWENQLRNLPQGLSFDSNMDNPSIQNVKGKKIDFIINKELAKNINNFCIKNNISKFIFLLSIYQLLLYQLFGKKDVVVGVPVSLRRNRRFQKVIGNFINVLPIRLKIRHDNFLENTRDVRDTFVNGMVNKRVPFSLIVERVNPDRQSKNPIFQTTFNFLAKRLDDNELDLDQNITTKQMLLGYELEAFPIDQQLGQMDLSLEIVENDEGFTGAIKYINNIFKREEICIYAERYISLIEKVINNPTSNIQNLRYSNDKEKYELIYEIGQNKEVFPEVSCVTDLIYKAAEENPDKIAIKHEDVEITYSRLIEQVNNFATYLEGIGVKKGDNMPVYMNKQVEVLIAMLAIMKVGAIYIPIDVDFPKTRVNYIIDCVSTSKVITTRDVKEKKDLLEENCIYIDEVLKGKQSTNICPVNHMEKVYSDDSAYILFTSGSTGKPKGVEIQHKALVNFLQSMKEIFGMSHRDYINISGVTSISFDISLLEFLLPLTFGGTTTILPKEIVKDQKLFNYYIKKRRVNFFQATPTTWKMILDLDLEDCKDLNVIIGGEMLSTDLSNRLTSRFNNVWNVYGPTEATIWATSKKLSSDDTLVSAGLPIHNMEAYILDEDFTVVQKKVTGKLYLGGVGLAKGYYNREDLTKERFFEIALDGVKKRVYDTGDLARYLENGEIQILGRDDDQVKLSGYRIELEEIEGVLNKNKAISSSAVIVKENRLIAYIVAFDSEEQISLEELRKYCKEEIPTYMIPSMFILVDNIPMTLNQKIDRKALSSLKGQLISSDMKFEEGKTDSENMLIELWKQVLGHNRVGLDDNFFELGGTSLIALELQQKIKNRMKVNISLLDIFTYPTVRSINNYLKNNTTDYENEAKQEELRRGKARLNQLRKRRISSY